MKIALINASPKFKESASEVMLSILEGRLSSKNEVIKLNIRKPALENEAKEKIKECDTLVFSFPLYVDGVPGHLLYCLREIENMNLSNKTVYAVMNCGFYEGKQNRFALDIIKNWCDKIGFSYNGGVGIGSGGCIVTVSNMGNETGPMKPIFNAMCDLAELVNNSEKTENRYLTVGLPRFFYKFAAQISWRQTIVKNGGKIKDLANRPKE